MTRYPSAPTLQVELLGADAVTQTHRLAVAPAPVPIARPMVIFGNAVPIRPARYGNGRFLRSARALLLSIPFMLSDCRT